MNGLTIRRVDNRAIKVEEEGIEGVDLGRPRVGRFWRHSFL